MWASIPQQEVYKIYPGIDNKPEFLEVLGDDGEKYKISVNSLNHESGRAGGKQYHFKGNVLGFPDWFEAYSLYLVRRKVIFL